jgi:hypothetical protein
MNENSDSRNSFASPRLDPVSSELPTTAGALYRRGAVLIRHGVAPLLLGDLRVEDGRLLWFAAFGDDVVDAGAFTFDSANAENSKITFRQTGGMELEIVAIDHAPVSDRDDYAVAWKIWLEVMPLQRAFIERAFARFRD